MLEDLSERPQDSFQALTIWPDMSLATTQADSSPPKLPSPSQTPDSTTLKLSKRRKPQVHDKSVIGFKKPRRGNGAFSATELDILEAEFQRN